jgi:hypothetical protein
MKPVIIPMLAFIVSSSSVNAQVQVIDKVGSSIDKTQKVVTETGKLIKTVKVIFGRRNKGVYITEIPVKSVNYASVDSLVSALKTNPQIQDASFTYSNNNAMITVRYTCTFNDLDGYITALIRGKFEFEEHSQSKLSIKAINQTAASS